MTEDEKKQQKQRKREYLRKWVKEHPEKIREYRKQQARREAIAELLVEGHSLDELLTYDGQMPKPDKLLLSFDGKMPTPDEVLSSFFSDPAAELMKSADEARANQENEQRANKEK